MHQNDNGISEDQVGASSFNLRKSAAVEKSLARIRNTLGKEWQNLQDDELSSLDWILKEAWTRMGFYAWDKINLAAITMQSVDELIEIGRRGRADKISSATAATEAAQKLKEL